MLIPIRCFTCGKVIANKWDKYVHLIMNWTIDFQFDALCKTIEPIPELKYLFDQSTTLTHTGQKDEWHVNTWNTLISKHHNLIKDINIGYHRFMKETEEKHTEFELALNAIGAKRFCCRRMFVSHVPMDDIEMDYEEETKTLPVNDTSEQFIQRYS
jgi:DNA-directed RNA polymerase subunit N (RpoN/RPB10)